MKEQNDPYNSIHWEVTDDDIKRNGAILCYRSASLWWVSPGYSTVIHNAIGDAITQSGNDADVMVVLKHLRGEWERMGIQAWSDPVIDNRKGTGSQ